jgi:hypothetical protein
LYVTPKPQGALSIRGRTGGRSRYGQRFTVARPMLAGLSFADPSFVSLTGYPRQNALHLLFARFPLPRQSQLALGNRRKARLFRSERR